MGQSLTHLLSCDLFHQRSPAVPAFRGDGIETPKGRTPLQGASLDVTSPRAKAPGLFCLTAPRSCYEALEMSKLQRPLRGHRKMSKSSDGRGRPSYIETRTSTSATRNPRNFQGLFPFSSALLSRMDRRGPFVARARPGRSTTSIQP
jgi:hypothetical protein